MTKVVVIGGTGLIGSKVVARLAEHGHEAIAASPKSGVNTLTGEGLAEVLSGAQVVVDVSNSPSFEAEPALDFFTTSTGNLLAAEKTAGVGHHVALSVVGTERLPDSGYLRAKLARTAVGEPVNGTIEIAGPEQFGLDELIRKGLSFRGDPRESLPSLRLATTVPSLRNEHSYPVRTPSPSTPASKTGLFKPHHSGSTTS